MSKGQDGLEHVIILAVVIIIAIIVVNVFGRSPFIWDERERTENISRAICAGYGYQYVDYNTNPDVIKCQAVEQDNFCRSMFINERTIYGDFVVTRPVVRCVKRNITIPASIYVDWELEQNLSGLWDK